MDCRARSLRERRLAHRARRLGRVVEFDAHHAAVDRVGERLLVAGRALDGIVESIEDPQRWYLGVQWHPEDDDGSHTDRMRLFAAFVEAAEQARQARAE